MRLWTAIEYGGALLAIGFLSLACEPDPQPETLDPYPDFLWSTVPNEQGAIRDLDLDRLDALGYLEGYRPAYREAGIRTHLSEFVQPGLNLYVSGHAPEAAILTSEGEVLHRWALPFASACPENASAPKRPQNYWRRARLLPDGSLLAVYDYNALVKIDRNSSLIWARCESYHHDIFVAEDGTLALLRRRERIPQVGDPRPVIFDDEIVLLTADGRELQQISIFDALERSDYWSLLQDLERLSAEIRGDILHTNTVKILDGRHAHRMPAFKRGNFLISVRNLNVIAIVDPDSKSVVWAQTGAWRRQHEPVLLESGMMLLFDNKGNFGNSRVIEFDPLTREIVWAYTGRDESGFLSLCCGSNQRLSNGNTLVTDTGNGRAFEVTPAGKIVWEFLNPHRGGKDRDLVAPLMEVTRLEDEQASDWREARPRPIEDAE